MMNRDEANRSESSGHERTELNMQPIILSLAGLLGIVLLSLLVVSFGLSLFSETHQNVPSVAGEPRFPSTTGPILDSHQADDLEQLREREKVLLSQYKWLDQQAGVARIPISRAIEIMSTRGLGPAPKPNREGNGP